MATNPTPPWGSTVTDDRLFTDITGAMYNGVFDGDRQLTHYAVTCRLCGDLTPLSNPQTLQQAFILRQRHLSEHLTLLGLEFQEASR